MAKNAVDFPIFSKIFNLFVKLGFIAVSWGKKTETKILKKTLTEGFSGNRRKNIQKIRISGEKRYCRKRVSGISESTKKSVLKAISDETR